jgi:hypothetical protein
MDDRPRAIELLAIARATLVDSVLPAMSEPMRYEMKMIANALGIAERELASQEATDALMPDAAGVAARIRTLDLDSTARAEIETGLRTWVRARLAISNPKLLAKEAD